MHSKYFYTTYRLAICILLIPITASASNSLSVNFYDYAIEYHGGGAAIDPSFTYTVEDNGNTIHPNGNGLLRMAINYTFTPLTIVEFDFKAVNEGEVHGIGFESGQDFTQSSYIKIYGTQAWGSDDYNNYSGSDWKHYTIAAGNYYSGSRDYMFFLNDDDRPNPNAEAYFKNVKIYDIEVHDMDPNASENTQDTASFTLFRDIVTSTATIPYVLSGTADSTLDYTLSSGLTFNYGESSATINVIPVDDNLIEADKTVIINIGYGGGGHENEGVGEGYSITITLTDDDVLNTGNSILDSRTSVLCGDEGYLDISKNDKAIIVLNPPETGKVSVNIYTLLGELVWDTSLFAVAGQRESVEWDPPNDLNSDIYLVYVKGAGIDKKTKIAVIK